VVYVASQLSSTYFMSGTMQASQRYLMMALPVLFIPFIIRFPAGLVLYWMTTNLWTVGQGLITRRLIPKTPPPTMPKRSSRTPPKDQPDAGDGAAPPKPKPPPQPPRQVKRKKKQRARR
jgi:YidC/Oxa1 family membrane protein insertase